MWQFSKYFKCQSSLLHSNYRSGCSKSWIKVTCGCDEWKIVINLYFYLTLKVGRNNYKKDIGKIIFADTNFGGSGGNFQTNFPTFAMKH